MRRYPPRGEKPLLWVGSSKRDLLEFPEPVVDNIGYALGVVQFGGRPPSAKPWKAIYVLHAFQKKSPSGIRTARTDVDRIGERLKAAQLDYEARYGKEEN